MTIRNNLLRFGVSWRGVEYKIFSIFKSTDESVYLHTYSKTSKTATMSVPTSIKNGQVGAPVDFKALKSKLTPFTKQKISFHQSGIIHSTDNEGERAQNDKEIRGTLFDQIETFAILYYLIPMSPDKYKKRTDKTKPCFIIDIEKEKLVPYAIICFLVKHDFDFQKYAEEHTTLPGIFYQKNNYLQRHQLDLVVSCHISPFKDFLPDGELTGYLGD